ncbi:Snf7-domain-containing protein [Backusella circina FSU 941]|nr:Snf7-domain-containing protein [Backusella circina FSU 941]
MNFLFGKKKTPAELLRQHQRSLTKAQRELDREREKLERQEKKLIADIKKSAKDNQMSACKIMAKDLVRTRRQVQKFYSMKTQLQAVGLRIQTLSSSHQMSEAMRGATKAMGSMNRQMNLPKIQQIMMEFEKESELMDMKDEMMGDAIDDAMEEEDDEEESDEIVNKVLDEIGINLGQELAEVPTGLKQSAVAENPTTERVAQAEGGLSSDDAALQARLDNLRRDIADFTRFSPTSVFITKSTNSGKKDGLHVTAESLYRIFFKNYEMYRSEQDGIKEIVFIGHIRSEDHKKEELDITIDNEPLKQEFKKSDNSKVKKRLTDEKEETKKVLSGKIKENKAALRLLNKELKKAEKEHILISGSDLGMVATSVIQKEEDEKHTLLSIDFDFDPEDVKPAPSLTECIFYFLWIEPDVPEAKVKILHLLEMLDFYQFDTRVYLNDLLHNYPPTLTDPTLKLVSFHVDPSYTKYDRESGACGSF